MRAEARPICLCCIFTFPKTLPQDSVCVSHCEEESGFWDRLIANNPESAYALRKAHAIVAADDEDMSPAVAPTAKQRNFKGMVKVAVAMVRQQMIESNRQVMEMDKRLFYKQFGELKYSWPQIREKWKAATSDAMIHAKKVRKVGKTKILLGENAKNHDLQRSADLISYITK